MLRPELLADQHLDALLVLELPGRQRPFTTLPARLLERARDDAELLPVVITEGGEAIGLFALATGPHRDRSLPQPDPNAVALSSLSLDSRVQGRGLGTQAMQLVPQFVRQHLPQAKRIILVVNQRNGRARRVYERAGFKVTATREGRIGPQWVMTLPIEMGEAP
ncbi:GNAT family N-acetyltransferase [Deinococcus marmoris]|uniref:N-acetyltransferase domain-containing protein n=1 Tax=Deinococcus marmoris TaxID=249408 RepID=A0A1U7NXH0_9DEIO|nr:GNAT family N-acetyltransferase [Deinococcus marmoris]OLV17621.1 hypothetical protein BOO71_0008383 [Deinococcus marmoris]